MSKYKQTQKENAILNPRRQSFINCRNLSKVLLGVCFTIGFCSSIYGQYPTDGESYFLPNAESLSPAEYQFLKYGQVPVSDYTGTATISIPIYTIKEAGFELPISVDYHSGGIKVAEEASWVGLGWDIQLGSIVQFTSGKNDFEHTVDQDLLDYIGGSPYPYFSLFNGTSYTPDDPDGGYAHHLFEGSGLPKNGGLSFLWSLDEDMEPDVMKASFFGHSLDFIIDVSDNVVVLNKIGYKVEKVPLTEDFGWTITTPEGIKFIFQEITKIHKQTEPVIAVSSQQLSSCGGTSTSTIEDCYEPGTYGSFVWRLSSIVTPQGGNITFNYQINRNNRRDVSHDTRWNVYEAVTNPIPAACVPVGGPYEYLSSANRRQTAASALGSSKTFTSSSRITTFSCISERALSSIEFSSGTVIFNTSHDRLDYVGATKLNQVLIKDLDSDTVKTFQFNYGYFSSSLLGYGYCTNKTTNELTKRLKLESVSETGVPPHTFSYHYVELPAKNSFATDYWGYYNGQTNNQYQVANILRTVSQASLNYPQLVSKLQMNTSNHSASLLFTRAGALVEIEYPTGGSTNFSYELNQFDNYILPDIGDATYDPTQSETNGLGLRISATSDWEDGQLASKNTYEYTGGKAVLPLKLFLQESDFIEYLSGASIVTHKTSYHSMFMTSTNFYPTSAFVSGNMVGYDKVIIRKEDGNGNSLGKTERTYQNELYRVPAAVDHRLAGPAIAEGLENGLLLQEVLFDPNFPVQETINEYEDVLHSDYYYGVKLAHFGVYNSSQTGAVCSTGILRKTLGAYYPIYKHASRLTKSTRREHIGTSSTITAIDNYSYNSYSLMSSTTTETSEGVTRTMIRQYPFNYPTNSSYFSTAEKNVFDDMVTDNILSPVIYERMLASNNSDLSTTVVAYDDFSGRYLPKQVRKSTDGDGWKDEFTILSYDADGNIRETQNREGTNIVYLWGYDRNYLIASIENTTLSQVEWILGSTNLSQLEGNTLSDQQIRDKIQLLRQHSSLSNSLVHTYTYKPSVGVNSSTDPNGLETTYEYDTSNRLIKVLDADDNIITQYEYNYGN